MRYRRALFVVLAATGALLTIAHVDALADPLTFSEAIRRALAFGPSIAQASANHDLSDARSRETRAPLLPSVGAAAEYYQAPGYNEVITNRGLSSGLLTANYTLWDWGRRMAQYRASRYDSQAAALGVTAARAQIVFDTSSAFYELERARASERELQQNHERLSRYLATVEVLRQSGRAITNDVLKIQSARDSAELALSAGRSDRQRASISLGSLMGDFSGSDIEIAEQADIPAPPKGDLVENPEMQAASRAISSASMQVQAAKAEPLPTFHVALTAGALGVNPTATINHNYGASYDGVISMPLFEGGAIKARIDQAKANENAAKAQLQQTHYLLDRRLMDAAARFTQAREALAILDRSVPTAEDAFALTWTRFLGGGAATMLEVLDSYEQAERLRLDRFNQQFAARQATAEIALMYGLAR